MRVRVRVQVVVVQPAHEAIAAVAAVTVLVATPKAGEEAGILQWCLKGKAMVVLRAHEALLASRAPPPLPPSVVAEAKVVVAMVRVVALVNLLVGELPPPPLFFFPHFMRVLMRDYIILQSFEEW